MFEPRSPSLVHLRGEFLVTSQKKMFNELNVFGTESPPAFLLLSLLRSYDVLDLIQRCRQKERKKGQGERNVNCLSLLLSLSGFKIVFL